MRMSIFIETPRDVITLGFVASGAALYIWSVPSLSYDAGRLPIGCLPGEPSIAVYRILLLQFHLPQLSLRRLSMDTSSSHHGLLRGSNSKFSHGGVV